MSDSDSDSVQSSELDEPYERETVDLMTRLSDTLDDFTADGGGDTESVSELLKRLSDIILKHYIEYQKAEPDPYDERHIERVAPNSSLAKVVKKIESDPEMIEKVIEAVLLHGGEEESQAAAHFLALVLPVLDSEESIIPLSDLDELDDFLFEKVRQFNRRDREMPLYCLCILAHVLEPRQQVASYKDRIRELISPLIKRYQELYNSLMRRLLRKQPRPGDLMGEFPLPKRARTPGGSSVGSTPASATFTTTAGGNSSAGSQAATSNGPSTSTNALSTNELTVPSTPTTACKLHPDSQTAATNGSDEDAIKRPSSPWNTPTVSRNLGAELGLRGSAANPADGLVSPQVTAAESSADEGLRHDCALHPMTDTAELRIVAYALAVFGCMPDIQGAVLPYALKAQMVSCSINLASLYARKKRWLIVVDCLKLVSLLVAHKKFALDLGANGGIGIQLLLGIPPSSPASTAVMTIFASLVENNRDTMERIYLMLQSNSNEILDKLVAYCVEVLECGHHSARSTSGSFLLHSFNWPAVNECFDKHDGLRKLLNQVMTLSVMSVADDADIDEEVLLSERQRIRDTLQTLQAYLLANFTTVSKKIIGLVCNNLPTSSTGSEALRKHLLMMAAKLKVAVYNPKLTLDNLATLVLYWPGLTKWAFVANLHSLGGVTLLLKLVKMSAKWKNSPLRSDVAIFALECLAILTLVQADIRLLWCETFQMPDNTSHAAMNLLLEAAEGSLIDDDHVQMLALQILATCVSPDSASDHLLIVAGHDHTIRCGEAYANKLSRVWTCVRNHHGIRVLVKLIQQRTPVAVADGMRALACMALGGLSRSSEVKQILSKLPLFNSGQMLALMAEPIAPVKMMDHRVFCQCAQSLINNVAGKEAATESGDTTLSALQRAYVVGQTEITYPPQELLKIIHQHLLDQGLQNAALALQLEAKLPASVQPSMQSVPSTPNTTSALRHQSPTGSVRATSRRSINGGQQSSKKPASSVGASPVIRPILTPSSATCSSPHVRVGDNRRKEPLTVFVPPRSPVAAKQSKMSLDNIVTHFLREQHSKCAHPMSVCPPFSLTEGHQCPAPQYRRHAPLSLSMRLMQRQVTGPRNAGLNTGALNRNFTYSRYRPAGTFEHPDDTFFTVAAFLPGDDWCLLGCHSGEIFLGKVSNDRLNVQIDPEFDCHRTPNHILSLIPSKSGRLLLSSSGGFGQQETRLWNINGSQITVKKTFEECVATEFTVSEDRFVAAYSKSAKIFDSETGTALCTLQDAYVEHASPQNFASFHPSGDLLLTNGILWDVRGPSSKSIRKFDSLNSSGCGLFHPRSGVEVIINSEIWDLRTFNLLSTCPQLDKCRLKFNRAGDIIFGVRQHEETSSSNALSGQDHNALQVVDGFTYQPIASVPMKKQLHDFSLSWDDSCLAVIENYVDTDWLSCGSDCRLYLIGQQRHWMAESEEDSDSDSHSGASDDMDDSDDLSDLDAVDSDEFAYNSDDIDVDAPVIDLNEEPGVDLESSSYAASSDSFSASSDSEEWSDADDDAEALDGVGDGEYNDDLLEGLGLHNDAVMALEQMLRGANQGSRPRRHRNARRRNR